MQIVGGISGLFYNYNKGGHKNNNSALLLITIISLNVGKLQSVLTSNISICNEVLTCSRYQMVTHDIAGC